MSADVFKTAASLRRTPAGCHSRVCVSRLRIDACGWHRPRAIAIGLSAAAILEMAVSARGTLGGLTQFALFSPESRP